MPEAKFLRLGYWKFPVKVEIGERASITQNPWDLKKGIIWVISDSARHAGLWVRNHLPGIPCLDIEVYGPRGGIAYRCYRGWESTIAESMFRDQSNMEQLTLKGI